MVTPKVSTPCTVHCTLYTCTHSTQQFPSDYTAHLHTGASNVFAVISCSCSYLCTNSCFSGATDRFFSNFRRFSPFFRAQLAFSRRLTPKQKQTVFLFSCLCDLGGGSAVFNRSFQIILPVPNIVLCVFMRADPGAPAHRKRACAVTGQLTRSPANLHAHRWLRSPVILYTPTIRLQARSVFPSTSIYLPACNSFYDSDFFFLA